MAKFTVTLEIEVEQEQAGLTNDGPALNREVEPDDLRFAFEAANLDLWRYFTIGNVRVKEVRG